MANNKDINILPLKVVQDFNKKYPQAMGLCDFMVQAKGKDLTNWDDCCIIPIAATLAVGGKVNKGNGHSIAQAMAAVYSWRKYKEIYSFDEDFAKLLYQQADDIEIPVEAIKLPYPCIFIQDCKEGGFFCWIENDPNDGSYELRFWYVSDNNYKGMPFILHLINGGTISDAVKETSRQAIESTLKFGDVANELKSRGIESVDELEEFFNRHQDAQTDIISKMLQLVLYICAENTQKEENPEQKKITRRTPDSEKKPKDALREVKKWDVGYRIGSAIRRSAPASEPSERVSSKHYESSKKRPHTRRGHYHHFWIGSNSDGTRRIVLKWVAPMFINFSDDDDNNPATIHPVK